MKSQMNIKNQIWLYILVIVIVIVQFLAIWIYFWLNFKRKNITVDQQIQYIDPYQQAMDSLNEINDTQWIETNGLKPYYIELHFILKRFIERQYLIPAIEMTTYELENWHEQSDIYTIDAFALLQEIDTACDLVKFAKFKPDASQHKDIWNLVHSWIETLKPKEVEHVALG